MLLEILVSTFIVLEERQDKFYFKGKGTFKNQANPAVLPLDL